MLTQKMYKEGFDELADWATKCGKLNEMTASQMLNCLNSLEGKLGELRSKLAAYLSFHDL